MSKTNPHHFPGRYCGARGGGGGGGRGWTQPSTWKGSKNSCSGQQISRGNSLSYTGGGGANEFSGYLIISLNLIIVDSLDKVSNCHLINCCFKKQR